MTALAIPPLGNYSIAFAASVECLRVTPWTSRSTTPEMMTLGAAASPEFSCLAFKATTGHFIKAAQEGVEYGVMVNSVGTCRLRYYREIQPKILQRLGLKLFIFGLGYDGFKPPLIRHFDPEAGAFLRCSARALLSRDPTTIAGRCTVFAESDMIHKQQAGHHQNDIVMGLCHAMARNFLSNVCAGKEIKPPIVLQGGVSANQGIRRAFNELLQTEVIVPRYNMVMGAYGAALIAARAKIAKSSFRGYGLCDHVIVTRCFRCGDCPNRCEVIEIVDRDQVIGRSGGRCRKWEQLRLT